MIVTCVYIHVRSEAVNSFIEATIANHKESVIEPGNLRFDLIQQADDPGRFMLYEAYESEESAAAHKNTPIILNGVRRLRILWLNPEWVLNIT
jgi:(4S)-4-hydroxy-5-phosphonooxypentane-2,3-dione isomerase